MSSTVAAMQLSFPRPGWLGNTQLLFNRIFKSQPSVNKPHKRQTALSKLKNTLLAWELANFTLYQVYLRVDLCNFYTERKAPLFIVSWKSFEAFIQFTKLWVFAVYSIQWKIIAATRDFAHSELFRVLYSKNSILVY